MDIKIASPISHLFESEEGGRKIETFSDCLELRDNSPVYFGANINVFHCEIQPIHQLPEHDFSYIQNKIISYPELELISFHIASCCDKPVLVNNVYREGGKMYSKQELLDHAKNNFDRIKKITGKINLAVENNNFYPAKAYSHITNPEFISEIVYANNIRFLFDIAHAKISALNMGIPFEEYLRRLPMDKCIQIHICKFGIKEDGSAFDAHYLPDNEEFEIVKMLINTYHIKYLTIEYYYKYQELISSIKYLKKFIE